MIVGIKKEGLGKMTEGLDVLSLSLTKDVVYGDGWGTVLLSLSLTTGGSGAKG